MNKNVEYIYFCFYIQILYCAFHNKTFIPLLFKGATQKDLTFVARLLVCGFFFPCFLYDVPSYY